MGRFCAITGCHRRMEGEKGVKTVVAWALLNLSIDFMNALDLPMSAGLLFGTADRNPAEAVNQTTALSRL